MLTLNFSPFPVIETNRLFLRAIVYEDADSLFDLRTNNEVLRFLDRDPFKSPGESLAFIEKILEAQFKNESILWVITLKENPAKMIGTIGFWRIIPEHYRAEIGYMLNPSHWRKGYMREAINAAVNYAFSRTALHSIEANLNPNNIASALLLKDCGFIQEAHFRENYYYNGVFGDSIIFSLIRK